MITISGKSVFGGVSIGKILFYQRNDKVIKRERVDDVDAEWKRFQDAEDQAVEQYRDRFLSPIKAYDAKHKSSLLETLRVYLQAGCNTQKAAQQLHSHYNTVVYRISNVERLLGLSIGDVETRLQLRIAYKLDQLR